MATRIAILLNRSGGTGTTRERISGLLLNSLGGNELEKHLLVALDWITDYCRVLAYRDDSSNYRLTTLGKIAVKSVLPLDVAAGFAQLFRDLLTIDPEDRLIERWTALDSLVALSLLREKKISIQADASKLAERIDKWQERNPKTNSLLYSDWLGRGKHEEVLGSLGKNHRAYGTQRSQRKRVLQSCLLAIVLLERAQGTTVDELCLTFGLNDFAGPDEKWRDEFIWLLSGVANIFDIKPFYYHLVEECEAPRSRIKKVKEILSAKRRQVLSLMNQLRNCSSLGNLLLEIRRTSKHNVGKTIGQGSIRRLEEAGVTNLAELARLSEEEIIAFGVQQKYARQIVSHIRRRLQ